MGGDIISPEKPVFLITNVRVRPTNPHRFCVRLTF